MLLFFFLQTTVDLYYKPTKQPRVQDFGQVVSPLSCQINRLLNGNFHPFEWNINKKIGDFMYIELNKQTNSTQYKFDVADNWIYFNEIHVAWILELVS